MQSAPTADFDWDVIIVGAGPAGLTLANHLGLLGVRTLVLEQLPALIDYPRGVGVDDESMRAFQAVGLSKAVGRHIIPNQILSFKDKRDRILAAMQPTAQPFGWPRRNGFIQPRLDRELAAGLERFVHVELRLGTPVAGFTQSAHGVTVELESQLEGHVRPEVSLSCRYLVGCDGGRSLVRNKLGLSFDGQSESTKWLVIDIANDPIGTPNAAFMLHQDLPHMNIGLPHGIRRYEFMVPTSEDEAVYDQPQKVLDLLARVLPPEVKPKVIRHRVYTHHGRIAPVFRKGRVLLGGDAAHVMPVWQGQGFNTGVRDASNLAWKLAMVIRGTAGDALLDSYTAERHPHALAMIELSVLTGKIFVPRLAVLRMVRDVVGPWISMVGPLRRYIAEMRFKPMPFFKDGIVVHEGTPDPKGSVGKMFIQPRVSTDGEANVLFDDIVGLRFAVLSWSTSVDAWLDADSRRVLHALEAVSVVVRPPCQALDFEPPENGYAVADTEGALKRWFDTASGSIVILRPDRIVAAVCRPWQLATTLRRLAELMQLQTPPAKQLSAPPARVAVSA